MMSRFLGLRSLALVTSRTMSYTKVPYKMPHMDEMPIPDGSWDAQYKKNNDKYNVRLLLGLLAISGTVFFIYRSPLMFMNAHPPPLDTMEAFENFCKVPKEQTPVCE